MIKSLFGKTKRKILALFFLNNKKQYYFSEVVRETGIRQGAVQRELKSLTSAEILNAEKRGRQTFYSVNKNNPIYEELRQIMFKTYAIGEVLASALKPLEDKIAAALIYGSVASETDTGSSDIDLFVIGKARFSEITEAISGCERNLARSVNVYSLTPEEFSNKASEKNHFVLNVLKSKKIFLIGSDNDLRRMAKKQVAKKGAV
jgi:predicted nucleotidyltransferase